MSTDCRNGIHLLLLCFFKKNEKWYPPPISVLLKLRRRTRVLHLYTFGVFCSLVEETVHMYVTISGQEDFLRVSKMAKFSFRNRFKKVQIFNRILMPKN